MTANRLAPAVTEPATSSPSSPLSSSSAGGTATGHGRHPSSFGETLRAIRLSVGLSQVALARAVGTTSSNLSRIEKGRWRPKRATVWDLAEALGTTTANRDRLLIAAGYPTTPIGAIDDPDLADLADILTDPDLAANYGTIRQLLRAIVTLYGVPLGEEIEE